MPQALAELDAGLAELDFGTPVLNQAWRDRGAKLLGLLEERWQAERGEAVRFEDKVETELNGVTWRGRIDRVDRMGDGTLRVVDYKTSKNPMTHRDASVALQLGFYMWALFRSDPDNRVSAAEFWHPLCEKGSWKRSFDTTNLEEVVKRLDEIAQAIVYESAEPEPWPPQPSQECGRCSVRSLCPAWPEGKEAFTS